MSPRPLEPTVPVFEEALAKARAGRFDDAVQAVEATLGRSERSDALSPAAANALAEVAWRAEAARDTAAAERALTRALRLEPGYADLHYRRACVLLALQRPADARAALERALELNPRYVAARVELAMLEAREGMIGEAIASLRELEAEQPVPDAVAFQRGISSLEHADWEAADAQLRRALQIRDEALRAQLEDVRARLRADEAGTAVALLEAVLPRHAGYPDLHYLMGIAELRLGRLDDAIASLAFALRLHPDFHDARVQLASALAAAGHASAAADQLATVLQHDPENQDAAALRMRWAHGTNAREDAESRLRKAS